MPFVLVLLTIKKEIWVVWQGGSEGKGANSTATAADFKFQE